jgi:hypothetical protein
MSQFRAEAVARVSGPAEGRSSFGNAGPAQSGTGIYIGSESASGALWGARSLWSAQVMPARCPSPGRRVRAATERVGLTW